MKMNKIMLIVVSILLLVFTVSCKNLSGLFFRDMRNLPEGEFMSSYVSPSANFTLNIYLCSGNATTDFSIRGELVDNDDNSKKNIYWSYHESEDNVEWLDDETVTINGHTLNVLSDVYDYRIHDNLDTSID